MTQGRVTGAELLRTLYARELAVRPGDPYLAAHARHKVADTQAAVFDWYAQHLPTNGRILDWGCRHAPDACLARQRFGPDMQIDGCDLEESGAYPVFHAHSGIHYQKLQDPVRLPYDDGTFDAVVASGTLEHVPCDNESLKELYRVLKVDGTLIVTYLPNRRSLEEWYRRRVKRAGFHRRLYRLDDAKQQLMHAGFFPQVAGYQCRLDLMPAHSLRHRLLRAACFIVPLHRWTSTIGLVAKKMAAM